MNTKVASGEFKYGINPGQRAVYKGLEGLCLPGPGTSISLNAMTDIQLGNSILSCKGMANTSYALVYIKHKMPLVAVNAASAREAVAAFLVVAQQTGNVDFGCAVSNFDLNAEAIPLLENMRMHTISAPRFDVQFLKRLNHPTIQLINRGVLALQLTQPIRIHSIQLTLEGGGVIVHDDPVCKKNLRQDLVQYNKLWASPRNFDLAISVLRHARTISSVILHDGTVKLVRCGFYDGIEGLEETLRLAKMKQIPLSEATVLSDGCFGVKSPVSLLAQKQVGGFVFCGGKKNDETILKELADVNISALCTKERYFCY